MSLLGPEHLAAVMHIKGRRAAGQRDGMSRALELAEISVATATDTLDVVGMADMIALDISLRTIGGDIPIEGGRIRRIAWFSMGGRDVDMGALNASTWLMNHRCEMRLLQWKHGYAGPDDVPARLAARLIYTARDLYRVEQRKRPAIRIGPRGFKRQDKPIGYPIEFESGREKVRVSARAKHLSRGTGGDVPDEVPEDRKPRPVEATP